MPENLHTLMAVLAVILAATFLDDSLAAQDWCGDCESEGPCLKFLDDLFGGCACSTRDTYEDPIETDRHDFTQSARTVGRGVVQLEAGYSYFYKDNNEEIENSHTFPEMLLRVGVSDDIEFRLRRNYAWVFKSGEAEHGEELEDLDGAQDLTWGFKLQLTGSLTAVSLLAGLHNWSIRRRQVHDQRLQEVVPS